MTRKLILIIMSCFFGAVVTNAQQNAQYSNFLFNAFGINPANAGLTKCLDARVGYRAQWVGFENNPTTVMVNAHQRINSISRERGVVHGVGIQIEGDNTGFTGRTSLHGVYAIHLPLSRNTRISFGVGLGLLQYRFDASGAFVPNAADPILQDQVSV